MPPSITSLGPCDQPRRRGRRLHRPGRTWNAVMPPKSSPVTSKCTVIWPSRSFEISLKSTRWDRRSGNGGAGLVPYLAPGSPAEDLHLVLAPHLPVPGFDSGTVPHHPDVQGENRQCEIPDPVFRGRVRRWSRVRDRNSWGSISAYAPSEPGLRKIRILLQSAKMTLLRRTQNVRSRLRDETADNPCP